MKNCIKCGKSNDDSAKFCEQCGNEIPKIQNNNQLYSNQIFNNLKLKESLFQLNIVRLLIFVIFVISSSGFYYISESFYHNIYHILLFDEKTEYILRSERNILFIFFGLLSSISFIALIVSTMAVKSNLKILISNK
jgi:hypothetical protein